MQNCTAITQVYKSQNINIIFFFVTVLYYTEFIKLYLFCTLKMIDTIALNV